MDFVDLHTHTQASDGSDSPAALVRLAAAKGLRAVAITDHDTVAGLDEAEEEGRACGIEVVRGCEVSTASPYGEIHILGLWLPRQPTALENVLGDLRHHRQTRNQIIVDKLQGQGFDICYEDVLNVAGGECVGRPHIAAVLMDKGYVPSIRDAFHSLLGQGGAAYTPRKILGLTEAVQLLSGLGATVCMAHPRLIRCPDAWLEATVQGLMPYGLTALEAYHSEHTDADQRHCVDLATRLGLDLSGGSDYHGTTKPGIGLGHGRGGLRVPYFVLEKLKHTRQQRGLPL